MKGKEFNKGREFKAFSEPGDMIPFLFPSGKMALLTLKALIRNVNKTNLFQGFLETLKTLISNDLLEV